MFHLKEVREELDRTIQEIERREDYDSSDLLVAMMHLYHHLNTAWNSRDASPEQVKESTDADFRKWRRFPDDVPLG